ncbi:MAG: hypothetical protein HY608_02030 [Planctomycetes bacterium]|nr:hypothetical protein [Planctomycetota bacterium]
MRGLLTLDRRWIFLLMAVVAFLPVLHPFNFPGLRTTPPVEAYFRCIDSLPPRAPFLISCDFDPTAKPELLPVLEATLQHAFRKDLRVVVMNLWPGGIGLVEQALREASARSGKERGRDFSYLGWKQGNVNVILGMGQEIETTYPADYYGKKPSEQAVFEGVRVLKDFSLVASLAAGDPGVEAWIVYGRDRPGSGGFPLIGAATGVMAANMYPYLQTGQLSGFIGGMKGAAEYEKLVGVSGKASAGMDVQSLTHFTIIGVVILGNLLAFLYRKEGAK